MFDGSCHSDAPAALPASHVVLSDIFPTGWHATELSGLLRGETVAIYGDGPVGLMAAHSAMIKGASRIFVVDAHDDKVALAKSLSAIPVDMRRCDPIEEILGQANGKGTDRGCECVGYQCCDRHGRERTALR